MPLPREPLTTPSDRTLNPAPVFGSPMTEGVRVGVDVGGTFTDVVAVRNGELVVSKTPSTPEAPDDGVLEGLDRASDRADIDPENVTFFAHGTTVATNAVLERDWAETALLTTAGFRDVLAIGRQNRPDIYDLAGTRPDPIVERHRRYEVPERLDERGRVRTPLDEAAVRSALDELAAADPEIESVAVSLLFAFENDAHERRIRELLAASDLEASVSLSSEVLPEIREYERTLATALNAALKPVMDRYVGRLETRIADRGVPAPLRIMQSNGGTIDADRARTRPIDTLLSGPAAGVQGAAHVAGLAGIEDAITMDMGGTSCDVSLVRGGEPVVSTDLAVGEYPIRLPMIGVHTIGAGGGSIAWIDAGGALRVGPRSAGARPGPVCYGRGGTAPTVTDAHVLLGRLDPDRFRPAGVDGSGGADGPADRGAVEDAMREHVADPLERSPEAAAQGVLDVADASMERALRVVSVERGHDPREFALVAFGGAGPLHATSLARSLDIPRVLVPRSAGVLSALGLLVSDLVSDLGTSMVRRLEDVDPAAIEETLANFEATGRGRLADAVPEDRIAIERSLDLRYVGQSYELTVPLEGGRGSDGGRDGEADGGSDGGIGGGREAESDAEPTITAESIAAAEAAFHAAHERRYGHAAPDEPVELVAVRLRARGLIDPPAIAPAEPTGDPADAIAETRPVVFDGERHDTRIYDRSRLPADGTLEGPAVVEGPGSTTLVRPGQSATVDEHGTLVVEVDP